MRLTILLTTMFVASVCLGQINITVNGNISLIGGHSKSVGSAASNSIFGFSSFSPSYTLKESYETRGGYGVGVSYKKVIAPKIELSAGLEFSSIAFKRNTEIIYDEVLADDDGLIIGQPLGDSSRYIVDFFPSQSIGESKNKGETRLNYISVPIYALYQVSSKLKIGLGIRNSMLISSKESTLQYVVNTQNFRPIESGDPIGPGVFNGTVGQIVEVDDTSGNGLSNFNLIGSLIINYSISDRISIQSSLDLGVSTIYEEERQIAGKSRLRSVSLGLNYGI